MVVEREREREPRPFFYFLLGFFLYLKRFIVSLLGFSSLSRRIPSLAISQDIFIHTKLSNPINSFLCLEKISLNELGHTLPKFLS